MKRWVKLSTLFALITLTYVGFPKLLPEASNPSRFGGGDVLFLQNNLSSPMMDWFTLIVYTFGYIVVVYGTGGFLLVKKDHKGFEDFLMVFMLSQTLGVITWALYPVAPPRLAVGGVRGVRESLMKFTLSLDPYTYGAFPSLHSANGLTAILFVKRHGKRVALVWFCIWILSIFSALYLGEHYWQDALAGCFYSIGPYLLVVKVIRGYKVGTRRVRSDVGN